MFRLRVKNIKKLSDENLFSGIVNGNPEMFEELYNRYNKRLLYYFYRMLGSDEHIAQDFLQELFFKILKNSGQYDPNRKFSTWIFSIAHNMCKNEYRSMEVRKIVVRTNDLDVFLQDETDERDNAHMVANIYSELEQLDETHKSVFLLKYRENLDLSEISEIMDVSVGTVKSRLHYARKKIQAGIQNRMKSMF